MRVQREYIIAIALLLAMPLFVVMGALSDRIGRKWIMMLGCLLAAISYMPIYRRNATCCRFECRDGHKPNESGNRSDQSRPANRS